MGRREGLSAIARIIGATFTKFGLAPATMKTFFFPMSDISLLLYVCEFYMFPMDSAIGGEKEGAERD